MALTLTINGETRTTSRDPLTPLATVLREDFALTGAKLVCGEGFCGACMVLLDGKPVMSCLLPAGLAAGVPVVTIEGLSEGGQMSPVQRVLEEHDVVQCGMCFPGMVMTLTTFLAATPSPTRDEMKAALTGNVCRCTGYERIVDAAMTLASAPGR
jgi:carbon-monoxide dehydrogenase small subunit